LIDNNLYDMPAYPGARRGRDDPYGSPPAQIGASAFTHTALIVNTNGGVASPPHAHHESGTC